MAGLTEHAWQETSDARFTLIHVLSEAPDDREPIEALISDSRSLTRGQTAE